MLKIQLIKDRKCKMNISGVKELVSSLTKSIQLDILTERYDFPEKLLSENDSLRKYYKQLENPSDYDAILLITDVPYDDNYFLHEYKELAIVSFYGWNDLTQLPKENGMLYWLCATIFYFVQTSYVRHYDTTGCLNDFLGDKTAIDKGMRDAFLCEKCLAKLKRKKLDGFQKLWLKDTVILLDCLSQHSRWNRNILSNQLVKETVNQVTKRKSLRKGEISVLIASPSDTQKEREILLHRLGNKFRTDGHEEACGYRIITHGWEDLASQTGYPQDIINELILPKIDMVVGILKHKLGTPTKDKNNKIRAESGTVEELYYAIEKYPERVLCLLYIFPKVPAPPLNDKNYETITQNWKRVEKFKKHIQDKVIYKTYSSGDELLNMVTVDLNKNIKTYISKK
jgi:hypothetical protein